MIATATQCADVFLGAEMMPAFDNYVSFGTQHFLSDPQYMIATVGMLKRVMEVCCRTPGE
jgi:hypothetical protein